MAKDTPSTTPRGASAGGSGPGVSLAFALGMPASRGSAFRSAMTALLHAGCSLGHEQPGHVISSYDSQGEHYAAPLVVPVGANPTLPQALDILAGVEQRYNRTIGFGLKADQISLPVTCRVYDEARALAVRLDIGPLSWATLVRARRSRRAATTTLIGTGRTLFTLLAMEFLLLGPTSLLLQAPRELDPALLRRTPVVLLAEGQRPALRTLPGALLVEEIPRGKMFVRAWDAGIALPPDAPPSASRRA